MFNLDKAYFVLDEMVMNGHVVEPAENQINKIVHLMVADQ